MKLIGFVFIETQMEFEAWQKNNPDFVVHTVQPHMRALHLDSGGKKYELGMDGATQWGIFVTYSYPEYSAKTPYPEPCTTSMEG